MKDDFYDKIYICKTTYFFHIFQQATENDFYYNVSCEIKYFIGEKKTRKKLKGVSLYMKKGANHSTTKQQQKKQFTQFYSEHPITYLIL